MDFIKAIDEYLFWLSQTGYFPPNYNVQKIIGVKAYQEMKEKVVANMINAPSAE